MNIKNQSFTLSLEDAFFEKQQKRVQIDPPPPPPPSPRSQAVLRLW